MREISPSPRTNKAAQKTAASADSAPAGTPVASTAETPDTPAPSASKHPPSPAGRSRPAGDGGCLDADGAGVSGVSAVDATGVPAGAESADAAVFCAALFVRGEGEISLIQGGGAGAAL